MPQETLAIIDVGGKHVRTEILHRPGRLVSALMRTEARSAREAGI